MGLKQSKQKIIILLAPNSQTLHLIISKINKIKNSRSGAELERACGKHLLLFEIYKMNPITNYFDLTLADWERFAKLACHQVDQRAKSQGEAVFLQLAESPDLTIIMSLANAGSETVLFVLFSYLSKYPSALGKSLQSVTQLIHCITSWQFRAFTFIRPNQPPLPTYVTRTIMEAFGIFLKILYENEMTTNDLVGFLINLPSNFFKLYLFKAFVDAVEVVDYDMGYMRYRTMVYAFQDKVIPLICDTLLPYFYNIEECVQITEISILQEHLNVTQHNHNQSLQISITQDQELQSDYVFMLLQKIVNFNYNITYSEYESDTPIDTCLISFPDKVSQKILNHQFLDALFYIIEKVANVKSGERKHKYLEVSLSCVGKLMQSRMTYMQAEKKEEFFFHSLRGLKQLLTRCKQLGSELLLQGILLCNKKLYMNCELFTLKEICNRITNSTLLFDSYLIDLTNVISLVFLKTRIQINNHLLQETVELTAKVFSCFGTRGEHILEEESLLFIGFARNIIEGYIQNLAQPISIFQQDKVISILESRPVITQLFEYFKKFGSAFYGLLFENILEKLKFYLVSQEGNWHIIAFANLLFLMAELLDHNYLERSIYLSKALDSEYCILGQCISIALQIINKYLYTRSNRAGKQYYYTDIAIVVFIEALLLDFLMGFEINTHFKIKQRLYLFMTYGEFYQEYSQLEDQKSEETITSYFEILTTYLSFAGSSREYEAIVQYVLSAIERGIFKLKWHMRREAYLKTQMFKYLSGFFQLFFYNQNHLCDVRSRVAKIIVTLTFDDVLDQYKLRINKFLSILKEQPVQYVQYDLIGIFEGLETYKIMRYFYNRLKTVIDLNYVLRALFERARETYEEKTLGDLCKLMRVILKNRALKISNDVIAYEVFGMLLPYLIFLLKEINQNSLINIDIWESSILEMMEIFRALVTGTYINIFLLDTYASQQGRELSLAKEFVLELMKMIVLLSPSIQSLPEMEQVVLGLCSEVNKSLLGYIFNDETGQLVMAYAHLHAKFIDMAISYMKLMINGNNVAEDKLIKCFDCLRSFFQFFNRKSQLTHRATYINNFNQFYSISQNYTGGEGMQNKNYQLIDFVINFILKIHRNNNTLTKTITRLLYELRQHFNAHFRTVIAKMPLGEKQVLDIDSLLSEARVDEELFMDKMKVWIDDIDVFFVLI